MIFDICAFVIKANLNELKIKNALVGFITSEEIKERLNHAYQEAAKLADAIRVQS